MNPTPHAYGVFPLRNLFFISNVPPTPSANLDILERLLRARRNLADKQMEAFLAQIEKDCSTGLQTSWKIPEVLPEVLDRLDAIAEMSNRTIRIREDDNNIFFEFV